MTDRKFAIVRLDATAEMRLLNRAAATRLLQLRDELGLSQVLFGIEIGISTDSVQRYEAAETKVPHWVILAAEARVRGRKAA